VAALLAIDEKNRAGLAEVVQSFAQASVDQKLAKNRNQYEKVAVPCMLWLDIRGSLMISPRIDGALLDRLDRLDIQGTSRPQKIYRILKNMEDSGVIIDESLVRISVLGILAEPLRSSLFLGLPPCPRDIACLLVSYHEAVGRANLRPLKKLVFHTRLQSVR
jgi:hypothetical protein